jgi:hypothetical protein
MVLGILPPLYHKSVKATFQLIKTKSVVKKILITTALAVQKGVQTKCGSVVKKTQQNGAVPVLAG